MQSTRHEGSWLGSVKAGKRKRKKKNETKKAEGGAIRAVLPQIQCAAVAFHNQPNRLDNILRFVFAPASRGLRSSLHAPYSVHVHTLRDGRKSHSDGPGRTRSVEGLRAATNCLIETFRMRWFFFATVSPPVLTKVATGQVLPQIHTRRHTQATARDQGSDTVQSSVQKVAGEAQARIAAAPLSAGFRTFCG